jgi:hypothetical protein
MLKLLTAGLTALFVTACPLAYAQVPGAMGPDRLSPADLAKLTDARIELVKAALQLTPDQMKYWPAVEDAIRVRAQNRQARIARIVETVGKRSDDSVGEILRNRDPIDFLNRRADALAQRSADLRKLADAWQPLYKTLTPEQKQRMAALTIFALHEMSNALEQRRMQSEDDDEWLVIIQ